MHSFSNPEFETYKATIKNSTSPAAKSKTSLVENQILIEKRNRLDSKRKKIKSFQKKFHGQSKVPPAYRSSINLSSSRKSRIFISLDSNLDSEDDRRHILLARRTRVD